MSQGTEQAVQRLCTSNLGSATTSLETREIVEEVRLSSQNTERAVSSLSTLYSSSAVAIIKTLDIVKEMSLSLHNIDQAVQTLTKAKRLDRWNVDGDKNRHGYSLLRTISTGPSRFNPASFVDLEFFLPVLGISRQVIMSSIQYYLGPCTTIRQYIYRGRIGYRIGVSGHPLTRV